MNIHSITFDCLHPVLVESATSEEFTKFKLYVYGKFQKNLTRVFCQLTDILCKATDTSMCFNSLNDLCNSLSSGFT